MISRAIFFVHHSLYIILFASFGGAFHRANPDRSPCLSGHLQHPMIDGSIACFSKALSRNGFVNPDKPYLANHEQMAASEQISTKFLAIRRKLGTTNAFLQVSRH
ncbi:hypothetical protein JIN85_00485 [Luteolibacter pohnpeiensis]|uniref:Uncharacterized protein n=1 Tax=Luteolibacter pohnpeiensis TaxID=454153 RepID=A0A934VPD0_9BACT|nr:hypothetical protein [Luteolibacter pohnpeiensis]